MKEYEDITDRIEAYTNHRLSLEERAVFEREMQQDPTLLEAVEREKSLSLLVLEKELLDIKAQMGADMAQLDRKRLSTSKLLGGLAGLVLLSAAGLLYFTPSKIKEPSIGVKAPDSFPNKIAAPLGERQTASVPNAGPSKVESTFARASHENLVPPSPTSQKTELAQIQEAPIPVKEASLAESKSKESAPPTNIQKTETENEVKTASPCAWHPEATIISTPSPKGENTGRLSVKVPSSISNGPFTFSLHKESNFVNDNHFDNLSIGNYSIYGKDTQGCIYLLGEKTIKETWCIENYQKTFSPDHDPTWLVPIQAGEEAHVKITDKTGSILFDNHGFTTENASWSGNLSTGAPVPAGVYKVFIDYKNGETCIASVTVFR
jgi:hypothetical protein